MKRRVWIAAALLFAVSPLAAAQDMRDEPALAGAPSPDAERLSSRDLQLNLSNFFLGHDALSSGGG